jgi:hypothetical protein
MIRPSSLPVAEKCAYSTALAERFPETSENAERGNAVDAEITAALRAGTTPQGKDARACVATFRELVTERNADLYVQELVALHDPETGAVLTEGTPDVQAVAPGQPLITVDWKKREQYFAGYLAEPDDNLQLHAYSVARGLLAGAESYENVLVLFGDGEAEVLRSRVYAQPEWWPFIERIRAIQDKERIPAPGAHCQNCWQRWLCDSYRERAKLALTIISQSTTELGAAITDEQAAELAVRAEQVKNAATMALDLVKAHHRHGGRVEVGGKRYVPTMLPGRRTADVAALERDGLVQYIRKGAGYERWTWRAVKP